MAHSLLLFLLQTLLLHFRLVKSQQFSEYPDLIRNIIQGLLGSGESTIGECNGCFCIPDDPTDPSSCPSTKPETDFSELIPILRAMDWENPYSLTCNPYEDDDCDTVPALEEGGACVIDFSGTVDTCPENWSYSIRTFEGTFEEAVGDDSLYVTHATPCGACSSLQDLAVYMQVGSNLTEVSTVCAFDGVFSPEDGVRCFQSIGFTEGCSAAWYYNTRKTAADCFAICGISTWLDLPPVKEPDCELRRCLACDEVNSGPIFKLFAGRTRRNSGLLSHIPRPCPSLSPLEHKNPCEVAASSKDVDVTNSSSLGMERFRFSIFSLVGILHALVGIPWSFI